MLLSVLSRHDRRVLREPQRPRPLATTSSGDEMTRVLALYGMFRPPQQPGDQDAVAPMLDVMIPLGG